jgi:ankyrin repeat protein
MQSTTLPRRRCTSPLIKARASVDVVDDIGWTPLHIAAGEGHADAVAALIAAGASADAVNKSDETPLHLASKGGYEGSYDEVSRALLNVGASSTALNRRGLSQAHYAAGLGLDTAALAVRDEFFNRHERNLLQPSAAELERRLRVAEMVCMEPHRQRRVAFAMGQHARLGAQSALRTLLDPGLVRMVLALAEECV